MTIALHTASRTTHRMATPMNHAIADLLATASLELGAHRPDDARDIAELLPTGTPVFVNHLPRHSLEDTLKACIAVSRAGLTAVPHLAARRVASPAALQSFLDRAVGEASVTRLLLIGGDTADVAGPYGDAENLLASGLITRSGIRELAFAAYPEGHARIPTEALRGALDRKLALAAASGLGSSIVTQFSFNPARILELAVDLNRRAPGVPVYVGVPGPTNPAALLRFAQACGVSASLRALSAQGFAAARLVTHTDPGEQVASIARHIDAGTARNIVGIHVFTFGGVRRAAEWINKCLRRG